MQSYASLEQRVVSEYLDTFPAFVPAADAVVSVEEQHFFYELMQQLFRLLYAEPGLLVPTLHEDDAFPTRYKTGYGKPELQTNLLKCRKAINDLLKSMYLLGQGTEVKLNKRQKTTLARLGVDLTALPAAWVWMSTRENADQTAFAFCLFDRAHCYTVEIYARLLGAQSFRKLVDQLQARGYQLQDQYNTAWPDYRLILSVANPAWSEEPPALGYEYKIRHTGIAAQYDCCIREPVSIGLCIPGGMKPWLERFDTMDPTLQTFVAERTKQCDNCRYCVQTDKTGKRPLAQIPVTHEGTTLALCPHFPGYRYCWNQLDDDVVARIIAFLAFMDTYQ